MTKTIMLIHGAWLTPKAWDNFRAAYEAQGFTVVTPAWPNLEGPVDEINASPNPNLRHTGLKRIVDHYEGLIRALPEAPILMGHSFGGLIVQLLMDRGLGVSGVAIDPGAPFGVIAHPQAVLTSLKVFSPFNAWNRIFRMSFADFRAGFANKLPAERQKAEYEAQIVPSPGRIFWQAVIGNNATVNWKNPRRAPLLLIAGEFDKTVPAPMVRSNFRLQKRAPSPTAFHQFKGRSHYLCAEPGWEEVADYALGWARDYAWTASQRAAADAGERVPNIPLTLAAA